MTEPFERLERRVERERRARLEAEEVAERATRELYESIREVQASRETVVLLERSAVAANAATDLSEAAATVLAEVCRHTGWPVGHLYLTLPDGTLEPTTVWNLADPERSAKFRSITEATPLRWGEGLPGRVLASKAPAWITDVTKDDNFPRARVAVDIGVRAGFGFPVMVGDDVVAVLEFFSHEPAEPDEKLLNVMHHIGTQLGRVAERMRAETALRESEEQNRLIVETANDAFVAIDASSTIVEWNQTAERLFGWSRDEIVGRSLAETIIPVRYREAHMAGLAHFATTGGTAVLGRRLELTAMRRDGAEFPVEIAPWSVAAGKEGRFNAFIRDITERKAFEKQLEHRALHDSLTGLPNRSLLLDRLVHALARQRRTEEITAVYFMDLDRFKAVNDSLGHDAGDQLLASVATRVQGVLRPGDTVARLGGDEFVVLCEDVGDRARAEALARRLIEAMAWPFTLAGSEVFVSASVGVALARGDAANPEQVLGDADLAMYRAKDRGRGVYEMFDESLRARLEERIEVEASLRAGIAGGELVAHYQPIVTLADDQWSGAEALVRWQHPDRGLLAPGSFIDVAEETGLVVNLGMWMLTEACRQLATWRRDGKCGEEFTMAVNVSVRQLEDPDIAERVSAVLDETGVPASALILEVTESAVMQDVEAISRTLWSLREIGVGTAIDDFGTAYSSLDRLRRMPVDKLKIDRSFVSDIDGSEGGTSLAAAMIAMAHSLGMSVVAEGVESGMQLEVLRRLGCDEVQGFLLARPGAASDTEGILAGPPATPRVVHRDATVDLEHDVTRAVTRLLRDGTLDPATRSLLGQLETLALRRRADAG